jgi:hypothetical protein
MGKIKKKIEIYIILKKIFFLIFLILLYKLINSKLFSIKFIIFFIHFKLFYLFLIFFFYIELGSEFPKKGKKANLFNSLIRALLDWDLTISLLFRK